MQNSFRHHGLGLLHANGANQFLQALTFGVEDASAECRQPIVAAPRVVEFWRGSLVRFLDQLRLDEPLDRSIEGRWPQSHLPGGPIQGSLHNAATVLLTTCE